VHRIALTLALVLTSCVHARPATKSAPPTASAVTKTATPVNASTEVKDGMRIPLGDTAAFLLADVESAKKLIARRDGFVSAMSALDRQARTGKEGDVSEADLLAHFAAQVRPFAPAHVERMSEAAKAIGNAPSATHSRASTSPSTSRETWWWCSLRGSKKRAPRWAWHTRARA
jgi:hypothetical protein